MAIMTDKKEFNADARRTAWKILKEEHFTSLPIRPSYFIKKYGIVLWTYQHYSKVCNCSTDELIENYGSDGFILFFHNEYMIIYNEKMTKNRINWTIMHEIAHYLLGHVTAETPLFVRNPSSWNSLDLEADQLVSRLLCPSAILHLCCVQSADEISKLCGISYSAAEHRFSHLQKLRDKNKFLTMQEEQEIVLQFAPFICSYLCQKLKTNKSVQQEEV